MHQHDSNALIHEEEQRLNRSEKEKVVLRYKSTSPLTINKNMRMKNLKKELRILNLNFIMWLSKNSQLKASKCPKELSQYS